MENLVKCEALEAILSSKRMPALFIGSGITKRYCVDYPDWNELLLSIANLLGINRIQYNAVMQKIEMKNSDINSNKTCQAMATYLNKLLLDKIEKNEIDLATIYNEESMTKLNANNIDYFKLLVAQYFEDYTLKNTDKENEELSLLKSVCEKISCVFTTNYDTFLETEVFPTFKVFTDQNKYYFKDNIGIGEIYKIHGTCKNPNSIIISESDYDKFEIKRKLVCAKLLNTIMDYPVIFIGYSLSDSNIQNLLSDFVKCISNTQILNEIKKYLLIIERKENEQNLIIGEKQITIEDCNVSFTTISTDNFSAVYQYIQQLKPCLQISEIRRIKTLIAEIISDSARGKENKIIVKNIDDTDDTEMAIYIDTHNAINNIKKSIITFTREELLMKALYEENIPFEDFANYWFDTAKIKSNEYTAVFYIYRNLTSTFIKNIDQNILKKFCNNKSTKEDYYMKKYPSGFNIDANIDEINIKLDSLFQQSTISSYFYNIEIGKLEGLYACNKISTTDYRSTLIKILDNRPKLICETDIKSAICFLDYYLYNKKSAET